MNQLFADDYLFLKWLHFFFPILEHLCPFLVQIGQMDLILPRWGNIGVLFCPDPHPQPLFLTLQSHTPFGDMYVHKTPQSPPQNTHFAGLNLKVGKMNYHLDNLDPKRAKCLKSGQIFSRSWQKKWFMVLSPDYSVTPGVNHWLLHSSYDSGLLGPTSRALEDPAWREKSSNTTRLSDWSWVKLAFKEHWFQVRVLAWLASLSMLARVLPHVNSDFTVILHKQPTHPKQPWVCSNGKLLPILCTFH